MTEDDDRDQRGAHCRPIDGVTRRTALQLGATLGPALLMPAAPALALAKAAGTVGFLKGDAAAEGNGQRRVLLMKENVFVDDLVTTGKETRLMLQLGARTTLKLGGDARLRIESYLLDQGGEFELANGALQFERTGKPASSDLKIRSAYGVIAVRGTRFFAGPSKGVFGVLVGSGRVEVTSGGRTVSVGAQQGTDIVRPGAAPSTPKPWGNARIREALASIR
jgi:hypothetical protein